MNGTSQQVKGLLALVAVLVGVIFGMAAGILAVAAGMTAAAAAGVSGGIFLTTVPVVLGLTKAVTS